METHGSFSGFSMERWKLRRSRVSKPDLIFSLSELILDYFPSFFSAESSPVTIRIKDKKKETATRSGGIVSPKTVG
ncbi:hypothetical protein AKJ16_DCAP23977 [Drosera capensis]